MKLNANEFDLGGGYITDRGTWKSDFSETVDGKLYPGYALNDRVHTSKGIYLSLYDDNITNPDTDATGAWRLDFSFTDVTTATIEAANAAISANKAKTDSEFQTAVCKAQTDLANELNTHQPKIGEDGYWYYWDATGETWVKTETLARGGEYLVNMTDDDCDFVMTAGTGDPADIFEEDDCNLNINA